MQTSSDTICAISTPPGQGAIAIIRICGENAITITDRIFEFPDKNSKLVSEKANTIHFGRIKNKLEYIDEVLVSIFKGPHSYTGEDIIEISCHGSLFVQQKILEILVQNGVRMAKPGEFTQKAFLNGKLDLSQAEGVADLIASSTEATHRLAFNQMRGGFSTEINKLRNELLRFVTFIELELDFSEEDVEFVDRNKLFDLVQHINDVIEKLIKSFENGNVIKNGVPVAIIGPTNAGKSTLLNMLLRDDKAIVSEIAGTTRDFIEDSIILDGIRFRFIDTAGIRKTINQIENEGIKRTFKKFSEASIVICLIDISEDPLIINESFRFLRDLENEQKDFILLLNKSDLFSVDFISSKINVFKESWSDKAHVIGISAKNRIHIDDLEKLLITLAKKRSETDADIIVTNVRHFEALKHSSIALNRVIEGINTSIPYDLIAQDIREVLHYLGEITGEITTDEILGNIFKNFCIGK